MVSGTTINGENNVIGVSNMNETEIEKQLERARSEYEASRWITGKHKREDGLMDFGDYVFEFTMERLGVEVKSYE